MISAHRICRTASGRVVLEGDPAAVSLIVGIGGTVPAEIEDEYKALVEPDAYPAVLQKAEEPVADKAVHKAPANKSIKKPVKKRK